jgi:3-phenylpropionate/trans-cinnamate dioxygenase ferredoxin reductase subunit
VGGGYIGLEAAASAGRLGADAVIIERENRCLARVACEPLSAFFQDLPPRPGRGDRHRAGVEAVAI